MRAEPAAPPPAPMAAPLPSRALTPEEAFARESLNDLNASHPLSDAFFDYDETALRDDARLSLQQDASWLAKWPSTKIRIDGHCDERGTAEFNLALGERRARAVSTYLEHLGIDPARITTETLGKEAPFCTDSSDSCWALNRRGHFVITAK